MGGTVSAGQTNDELIDNLVDADCIKNPRVEKVFRGVDRAHYYLPEHRDSAYKDLAWKNGNIHLSAPCIYAEVMEALKLEKGLRFLNLGSGTGYLSTLAGLMLGSYGVNHGVEYHQDNIDYARERLEEFKKIADAFDEHDFCEPVFTNGNCLLINSGCTLYDRVYCGASCPQEHENYMKNLIRVGGILVMPLEDHLLQITRVSDTEWETKSVLPVSFASLIPFNEKDINHINLPEVRVMTLQEMVRVTIRAILRNNIRLENPNIKYVKRVPKRPKRPRIEPRRRINILPSNFGMMLLGSLNDSDSDEDGPPRRSQSSRDSEGSNEAPSSSSRSSRSSDDPGADYILQQMMAMQQHFFDMSQTEQLQEQDDVDEEANASDEDQGIDVHEPSEDGSTRKRPRRRAYLDNGALSTDSESGAESADKGKDRDEAASSVERSTEKLEPFAFPKPYTRKHCVVSTSSGEEAEVEDHVAESSCISSAIPITQTTAERRRYSSTASVSTSVTSGFGTCSSMEETAEMEGISRELETHAEEGSVPEAQDVKSMASSSKVTMEASEDLGAMSTNGAKNGASANGKSEGNSGDLMPKNGESVSPMLCDIDQSYPSTSNGASKLASANGVSKSSSPPKVSINAASPVLDEGQKRKDMDAEHSDEDHDDVEKGKGSDTNDDDDDDEGEISDVDMNRVKDESSSSKDGEEAEENMDQDVEASVDSGLTYRQCMKEKVDGLPIPGALKQYLLHYRT